MKTDFGMLKSIRVWVMLFVVLILLILIIPEQLHFPVEVFSKENSQKMVYNCWRKCGNWGGPWIYFTRVLAVTILKSCYCSSGTRQYRKFLTHSLYEKGIFPCDFSLKGCPRFTQIVYLLVDKRCPDVLIRLFVKLYLFYLFKIRKTTFLWYCYYYE